MVHVCFTVVRFTLGYNSILGRSTLHAFQAITSTYHQCLKFPTKASICCIRGSQQIAQSCYMVSTYSSKRASFARKRRLEEVMENTVPRYLIKSKERGNVTSSRSSPRLQSKNVGRSIDEGQVQRRPNQDPSRQYC